MIPQVSGGIHFRVLPLPACYVQFHSATVSTYEEEGIPAWKRAKRCCPRCSLGRTRSQRCRCACFRTPRAVSAAIGRFDHLPSTQVHSKRPLQPLPLLRTAQPQQSYHSKSGRNAEHAPLPTYVSSSLPVKATALVTHAPMRRAVTRAATALRYTALRCAAVRWKALCCAALRLHCTCTAPCSALAVVAVVYAHCTRAHAALWGRLVMRKRW